ESPVRALRISRQRPSASRPNVLLAHQLLVELAHARLGERLQHAHDALDRIAAALLAQGQALRRSLVRATSRRPWSTLTSNGEARPPSGGGAPFFLFTGGQHHGNHPISGRRR